MELVRRFADLLVRVGVNVQPGQQVVVQADVAHLEIVRAIVESAYAAGEGIAVTGRGPHGTVDIIRDDDWVL
jgi:leucyl aminopeptidase (aminopeptidase T)